MKYYAKQIKPNFNLIIPFSSQPTQGLLFLYVQEEVFLLKLIN